MFPVGNAKLISLVDQHNFWRNGFRVNLDNDETQAGDFMGCGIPEQTRPDGTPGIDSACSGLLPDLEATQAVAINGLIEDAIKAGELILM